MQREASGAVMSDARMYGKTATKTRRGARLLQRGDEGAFKFTTSRTENTPYQSEKSKLIRYLRTT